MPDKISRVALISATAANDDDNELIKRNQRTKIARLSRKILEFSLAFISIDVLQGFEERRNDSPMRSAQLQQQHWLERFWSRISCPLFADLIARCLLTFSLRFILNCLSLGGSSRSSGESILERKLRWLLDVNGDPSCSVDKLTMAAYLGPPIFTSVFCVALPYYQRNIHPFDCTVVRYLLDPKREIQRLSGSALRNLNFVLDRVEQQRRELTSLLGISLRFGELHLHRMNLYDGQQLRATLVRLMEQSKMLRHFRQNLKTIRPPVFRADWLQLYHQLFVAFYCVPLTGNIIVFGGITGGTIYINWQSRCSQQFSARQKWLNDTRPSECSFVSQFKLVEWLIFAEISLAYQVLAVLNLSIFLSLIFLISFTQFITTIRMSESLSRLLAKLHRISRQSEQVKTTTSIFASVESAMYENIFRLWTHETESQRNVAQLGILMTFYIALVCLITLASFGTYLPMISASSVGCEPNAERPTELINARADLFATVILLVLWFVANIFMLICSVFPSQVAQMKRLVVSIVAETIEIKHSQVWKASTQPSSQEARKQEIEGDDPLMLLWRQTALSPSFLAQHHPVRVFDFKITHGKVLELNFYVIALASLLNSRR